MFCRNCGKELNDDAVFCNGCGEQLRVPDPAMQVTAPMQPVPAAPAVAETQGSRTGLIVALAVVGVLVVGAAVVGGLYVTGVFGGGGITASRTDEGTAAADKKDAKTATGTIDGDTGGSDDTSALTDAESYDVLAEHYATLSDLADQVGRANTDGSYGGTGFAYEVFNAGIGSQDLGVRESLVDKCQTLLDTVSGQKQGLDEAQVSSAYTSQKAKLLSLYALLETRVNAMLVAAKAAVDNPDESAWRPILSPASTDSREQFEADYPGAAPVKQ